jgi:DNA polymerase
VILVGDLSQIECRMLNWLAGEEWVLQAFRDHRDLYSEIATDFYGRPISKAERPERGLGKQIVLSCGFGSGGPKIVITARRGTYGPPVDLTQAQGMAARDLYRQKHPKVVTLWNTGAAIMGNLFNGTQTDWKCMKIRDKKVYLPNGAWLDYSNLVYKGSGKGGRPDFAVRRRQGESRIYGSKFIQNIVEALSRLVLTKAMLEMQQHFHARLCTHDEGVWLVPVDRAQEAAAMLQELLTTPPEWCPDIPLEAEVGFDVRYTK